MQSARTHSVQTADSPDSRLDPRYKCALDERISMKPPALTWPKHRHKPPRNTMHAHVQHTLDRQGSRLNYQLFELP